MTRRSVLLCGATGLVGGECLRLLVREPAYERVVVLARRPLQHSETTRAAKVEEHLVDFDNLPAHRELFRVDQIICALGTTIRQAGSQERFRAIDYGYVLDVARRGLEGGAHHFLLVSAMGANARSPIFYNRVKGEVEQAILALSYRSMTIVRPSLLMGERREARRGEELAKRFAFLFPKKYRPISARSVAAALVRLAVQDQAGRRIIESAEMQELARRQEA